MTGWRGRVTGHDGYLPQNHGEIDACRGEKAINNLERKVDFGLIGVVIELAALARRYRLA
jgi:hypothetical protein